MGRPRKIGAVRQPDGRVKPVREASPVEEKRRVWVEGAGLVFGKDLQPGDEKLGTAYGRLHLRKPELFPLRLFDACKLYAQTIARHHSLNGYTPITTKSPDYQRGLVGQGRAADRPESEGLAKAALDNYLSMQKALGNLATVMFPFVMRDIDPVSCGDISRAVEASIRLADHFKISSGRAGPAKAA